MAAVGAFTCDVATWQHAFESYWREYPKAQATDLYKFAHQGIMGSEHAVGDGAGVREWMQREIARLPTRPEAPPYRSPIIEPLPPEGRFVRIHLRPYLMSGGSPDALAEGFLAAANGARGDTAAFSCALQGLAAVKGSHDVQPVVAVFRAQQQRGYEAVHHSAEFEAAYAPAYRVVNRSWVTRLRVGGRQR